MNLLEELIFTCGIKQSEVKKIEAKEDEGYSTANCGSIEALQDYVILLQDRLKESSVMLRSRNKEQCNNLADEIDKLV